MEVVVVSAVDRAAAESEAEFFACFLLDVVDPPASLVLADWSADAAVLLFFDFLEEEVVSAGVEESVDDAVWSADFAFFDFFGFSVVVEVWPNEEAS